jgi:glutathione S-transferase
LLVRILRDALPFHRWRRADPVLVSPLPLCHPRQARHQGFGPFKQALDRYKYAPRHPERTVHAWRDEAVELMLAPLNARLADRPFLLRDTPSLADMAIAPFIRQFAAVDPGWFDTAPLEPLRAWTHRIVSSELFDSVMSKFTAWRPGDTETTF